MALANVPMAPTVRGDQGRSPSSPTANAACVGIEVFPQQLSQARALRKHVLAPLHPSTTLLVHAAALVKIHVKSGRNPDNGLRDSRSTEWTPTRDLLPAEALLPELGQAVLWTPELEVKVQLNIALLLLP